MNSFLGSQCPSKGKILEVRRSGRKRVKLNHKKNHSFSKPVKLKRKMLPDFKPSRNFHTKPQNIKLSPYDNSKRLGSLSQPQRSQVLDNMKQAVREQQKNLKRLFSIKLIQEMNFSQEKISCRNKKVDVILYQKTQTFIIEQKFNSEDYESEFEVKKDLMEIGTAEQIEYFHVAIDDNYQDQDFMVDESEYYLAEIPTFKKQTSKLLSDNYENQELLYTIQHIVPNWHREEIDMHGQLQFSNE